MRFRNSWRSGHVELENRLRNWLIELLPCRDALELGTYPKLDVQRWLSCVLQFKYSSPFHSNLLGSPMVGSFECSHIRGGLCSPEYETAVRLDRKQTVWGIFESCALMVDSNFEKILRWVTFEASDPRCAKDHSLVLLSGSYVKDINLSLNVRKFLLEKVMETLERYVVHLWPSHFVPD